MPYVTRSRVGFARSGRIAALCVALLCSVGATSIATGQTPAGEETRVVVESRGWQLAGDLRIPPGEGPHPAVLMLNEAAGDRSAYRRLAERLASRGIASLRIDLPGHGESTNLGRFVPDETDERDRALMIEGADVDVTAALRFLKGHHDVDSTRIGVVGASYSAEEMAEAARKTGYMAAYVALSPGSFSDASIDGIDNGGAGWLLIVAEDDPYLTDIVAAVQTRSTTVQFSELPGTAHGTEILKAYPEMIGRITVWMTRRLR